MKFGLVVTLVAMSVACGTSRPQVDVWPQVDALPSSPPSDLDVKAAASTLRRAGDGYLYVVGGIPDAVDVGSTFHARYSGDWPLNDLPRPALARGTVLRRYDDQAAVVSLDYQFPSAELEGLEISWDEATTDEKMGKGLGTVLEVEAGPNTDLRLDVGTDVGVQTGDIYAIVKPAAEPSEATDVQVPRRLTNICLVDEVADETSTCRLWRGSRFLIGAGVPNVGDEILFMEHTFGRKPRPARILIAQIEGDEEGTIRETLTNLFQKYSESVTNANLTVETSDRSVDATREDFFRYDREFPHGGVPTILVGASIVDTGDGESLMLNYTGIGPASGPGMFAAPPEGGVSAGPPNDLDAYVLRAFAGTAWGGVQVLRGQTSEALMHLHLMLRDKSVYGPLRWHIRDQYAMRWAALGNTDMSIWLVAEDEAAAQADDDQKAYLNALGTMVRLLERVGQTEAAVGAAREYLDARQGDKPSSTWLSAVAMYAEMLTANDEIEEAKEWVDVLLGACPDGCGGDLNSLLSGVYWTLPEEEDSYREELLERFADFVPEDANERQASVRYLQGINALQDERFDDALIAFLEAERLFDEADHLPGVSRAKFYNFVTQLRREEPQKAFETAIESLETTRELRDFESAARTYEVLANLYMNLAPDAQPGPYLAAAQDVMLSAVKSQLARGDFAGAADSFFSLGVFLVKVGQLDRAQSILQQGILFAIRSASFDVAAMSHLYLGLIARNKGDQETFLDEINRARVMGSIADDPSILETIEEALKPPEPEAPTQVL